MIRPLHPYIIDIEASGFGSNSYPIEVGLALEPDQRYCRLIRPVGHWHHWDKQAETVHGISRDILIQNGRAVTEVALELNDLIGNGMVFSDAWGVDDPWISKLYAAAAVPKRFSVRSLEMIMTEAQIAVWEQTRDSVVLDLGLDRHRASNDARIIQEIYRRTRATTA